MKKYLTRMLMRCCLKAADAKWKGLYLFFAFCAQIVLASCGSLLDGMASMYGGGYGGYGYNPYSSMWSSGTTVPAALDPVNAANGAAAVIKNNVQNQMNDMWEHPENYQNVPVQSASTGSTTTTGTGSSSSSSSSPRPTTSQHDLCNGTGKCKTCNGTGLAWIGLNKQKCPICGGSGTCKGCNGTGRSSAHYY